MKNIKVDDIEIGNNLQFTFIAGQCIIEDESSFFSMAKDLKRITSEMGIPFIFKMSYDKANRSSVNSYRGPGVKRGLELLKQAKEMFDIKALVDVHLPKDMEIVAEVADVVQIPAFLCRQTDLLIEAGKTGLAVNIKKGQFISPNEVGNMIEKIYSTGNEKVMITERGTLFGYNNLVVDMRSLDIIKDYNVPVIFDATHSVQQPGGLSSGTGGERRFVPVLSKAAVAVGVAGIYMEVHQNPAIAKSDSMNQWPFAKLKPLLEKLVAFDRVSKND